jgi:hypothetical protein
MIEGIGDVIRTEERTFANVGKAAGFLVCFFLPAESSVLT